MTPFDDFPTMLTAEESAEYVRAKSVHQFRREVKAGVWPGPLCESSRPQRWLRSAFDRILFPAPEMAQDRDEKLRKDIDRALGLE